MLSVRIRADSRLPTPFSSALSIVLLRAVVEVCGDLQGTPYLIRGTIFPFPQWIPQSFSERKLSKEVNF